MYVLDSSAIISGVSVPVSDAVITPGVYEEVKLKSSHMLAYAVEVPAPEFVERVVEAAKRTGDYAVLSDTDIEVLALALQKNAVLVTDDYAMQNVADFLKIPYDSAQMRGIKEQRRWKWRCESCGRYYRKRYDECPVCGGRLRRVRGR